MAPEHTTYRVKWVCESSGRSVPIALQGANGPCALLALLNVQFQSGALQLPGGCTAVSETSAMSMLAELAMRGAQSLGGADAAAREIAVQNFIELLPTLRSGMHVNVRFSSPTAFEFTKEIAAFDCFPDIRLVHGWLVDPQDRDLAAAFGTLSYNQVMDELVRLSVPVDVPAPPPPDPPPTLDTTHDQIPENPAAFAPWPAPPATDGAAGVREKEEEALDELVAPVVSAEYVDDYTDIDLELPPHLQPSAPPPAIDDAPTRDELAPAQRAVCDSELRPAVRTNSSGSETEEQDVVTRRESGTSTALAQYATQVMDFFNAFPTQLTYHGIVELHALLHDGETCILFRNSHFYVLRKHGADLYTLATDVGFEKEHDIAWELLRDVNGDSSFYSALFTPSVPTRARVPVASSSAAPCGSAAGVAAAPTGGRPARGARAQQPRVQQRVAAAAPSRRKSERRDDACCIQ